MFVHTSFGSLNLSHPVVTTGVFDGVHIGHKALLDHLVKCARAINGESVVITFNPPPRLVLAVNKKEIFFLTTLEEKKRLLDESGIDHMLILDFNEAISNMSAYDFVKEILAAKLGTEHLIIGYDHHFGKLREGNFESVRRYAEEFSFSVEQIGEILYEGGVISSTAIRDALLSGRPDEAGRMLGYHYSINGTVVRGKGLGKKIGFPTANIDPDDTNKLIPVNGVYAVTAGIENRSLKGILSIGYNPTVNRELSVRSIEVHIPGFTGDLYGSEIRVFFRYFLRTEKRFNSLSDLTDQMKLDEQYAMKLLA